MRSRKRGFGLGVFLWGFILELIFKSPYILCGPSIPKELTGHKFVNLQQNKLISILAVSHTLKDYQFYIFQYKF